MKTIINISLALTAGLLLTVASCKKNNGANSGGNSNGADGKLNFDFSFSPKYYLADQSGGCPCNLTPGANIEAYDIPKLVITYTDGSVVYTANTRNATIQGLDLKAGVYNISYKINLFGTEYCNVDSDKRRIIGTSSWSYCIRISAYNYKSIDMVETFTIEKGKTTFVSKSL